MMGLRFDPEEYVGDLELPPGTVLRDISSAFDDYRITYDMTTWYEPALNLDARLYPLVRTVGSFSSTRVLSPAEERESLLDALQRLAERHREHWEFIHGPEYAMAWWRVKHARGGYC